MVNYDTSYFCQPSSFTMPKVTLTLETSGGFDLRPPLSQRPLHRTVPKLLAVRGSNSAATLAVENHHSSFLSLEIVPSPFFQEQSVPKKLTWELKKTCYNSIETHLPNLHVGFQLLIFELTSELSLPMLGATHGPPLLVRKWMAMDTNQEKVG